MRAINPPGPQIPGISQAMLIPGGDLLILSGHIPLGPDGIVGDDLTTQLEQIFENMAATLREAGADFSNVARLTIYVRDYHQDMLPTIRAVRDRYVNLESPPASALIGVAALAFPEILVEVDAIAGVPRRADAVAMTTL
tara:strand:+ start:118 stop:534 length:417 start_codon:yes stop_codon:yes gene_type:complete